MRATLGELRTWFMVRLVTNLLSLAHMAAGQTNMHNKPVDSSKLMSEVVERMALLTNSAGVSL